MGTSLTLFFLLTSLTPMRANIGDDLAALRGRYGSAKELGGQMLFEVRLADEGITPARGAADTQNHLSITVYFDGEHSGMEIFARNTSDPAKAELSSKDIDSILAAESEGQTWDLVQVPSGKRTWMRSDRKIIARFSPDADGKPDSASVLVIMANSK